MSRSRGLVVVVPVHRNAATLAPLVERLGAALRGVAVGWSVRLVVDACPEGSGPVASALAARDPRVRVTLLERNLGQHGALAVGLRAEPEAAVWVCMDADLQDPPEAVPALVERLTGGGVAGVFAGRRGAYESRGRRLTGTAHRRLLATFTGLPPDAGGFFAMDARLRAAVLTGMAEDAPSVVAAAGAARLPLTSIPVQRAVRAEGTSSWTSRARLRQSQRTLAWMWRRRRLLALQPSSPGRRGTPLRLPSTIAPGTGEAPVGEPTGASAG
jgi:polyisoprenyl-phosphate glycosyltransferase